MVILLCVVAIAMIVSGVSAITFGVQVERDWAMVISGTVGAASGVLALGLALVAQRLGRIGTEISWIRDRLATIGELAAEGSDWRPVEEGPPSDGAPPVEEAPPAPAPAPAPSVPPPERVLVGQYSSGGNQYTMFSDGSIDATTPAGLRRFTSLEELRAFVAGGGERG